jgi:hypothetical protein
MSFHRKVWKWQTPPIDYFVLEMPKGAKILNFSNQHNQGCLWALVDPDAEKPKEKRVFRLAGTDHAITESEDRIHYLGTFVAFGAHLVLHLFEILNVTPEEISEYERFNREDIDDSGFDAVEVI